METFRRWATRQFSKLFQSQSVSAVENARAKERQGTYLSPLDRETCAATTGNDDYGPRYGYAPYYGRALLRRLLRLRLWLRAGR